MGDNKAKQCSTASVSDSALLLAWSQHVLPSSKYPATCSEHRSDIGFCVSICASQVYYDYFFVSLPVQGELCNALESARTQHDQFYITTPW